jgi:uncharacterized protein
LMAWEVWWALVLGFAISAIVQAWVPRQRIEATLAGSGPRPLVWATGLGAASSSCSYAAVAIAKSLFEKGASASAALAFQFASTNLVWELGLVLWVLIGWQFTLAEFVGGPIMIALMTIAFRLTLKPQLVEEARIEADRGVPGSMEGHAGMDMSVTEGSLLRRVASPRGFTAISHYFVMDWLAVWKDVAGGLLIAGALAAWVPMPFWNKFFLTNHPIWSKLWGPLVGPLVAIVSFVCSIGNVPLAAVLWNGGSSFGGVIAFIYADLIVIPILDIYRKYYGLKMSAFLLVTMYASMASAALVIELLFQALHLVPAERHARIVEASVTWNYTTVLNIIFLAMAALLLWRFFTTGGVEMARMMDRIPERAHHAKGHAHSS